MTGSLSSILSNITEIIGKISENYIDIFVSQVSVSFLVISFLTVLGSRDETVLWEDIIQFKLVNPKYLSFRNLTDFCFLTVLFSIGSVIFKKPDFLAMSYILDIIILTILTIKMIRVYYDKKRIKQKLIKKYENMSPAEQRVVLENLVEVSVSKISKQQYTDLNENIKFLSQHEQYEYIAQILSYFPVEAFEWFYKMLMLVINEKQFKAYEAFEEVINQYIKRLIMSNQGNHVIKTGLIKVYFSRLNTMIFEYLKGSKDVLLYAAMSRSSVAENSVKERETNALHDIKKYDKLLATLQYAYYQYDWDTIDIIIRELNTVCDNAANILDKFEKSEADKFSLESDSALWLAGEYGWEPKDILGEDEIEILSNILSAESSSPRIGVRLKIMIRMLLEKEYEPSREELELIVQDIN